MLRKLKVKKIYLYFTQSAERQADFFNLATDWDGSSCWRTTGSRLLFLMRHFRITFKGANLVQLCRYAFFTLLIMFTWKSSVKNFQIFFLFLIIIIIIFFFFFLLLLLLLLLLYYYYLTAPL